MSASKINLGETLVCNALLYLVVFSSGSTITAEIQGVIDACVKLTGMPDLTLSFMVRLQTVFSTLKHLVDLSSKWIYIISLVQNISKQYIHGYKSNPKSIKCLARNALKFLQSHL